ncbi:kinetochore scaffold 1 isoform X2 [Passer domesticus]|uniref:kinetochore scaffold 1 isoform X2 n=1 Tax=Passer domesticus TaxID=48849 RepID=UPI0030FEC505
MAEVINAAFVVAKAYPSAMDKIYTDPNVEMDNTEHIRRKRLSSILKAPRNPLDDLGNGNEMTEDIHTERRRRSSRRVSFASTINCRVFQRDLKNSTSETENTECSANEKDDTLTNQNEDPEAVPCEITGMNTLLHAPIQALGQQTEWHDVDHAAPRTDRQDTTLLFSEENEMEMTASHTAMISRNLSTHQPDRTKKIDFTSFLAKLNSSQGKAEASKELSLLSDSTNHPGPSLEQKEEATAVKKIDFNEFLQRVKSNNPAERPDKDSVDCVPSQGSGDVTQLSGEFGCSHEPPDTCNVTRVFRGREGGMEMTKCEAADVKIPFPGVSEVPAEQWECGDVTEAFADQGMDVTTSHTAKVSFALSAAVGNQSLSFQKDFPPEESDNSVFRRASNHSLNVQQDTCNVTRVFRGREGGMEMTKCEAADVKIPFPGVSEVPAEQWECGDVTKAFADEGMDVTTSHTAKVSFALSTAGSQSLNFQKDFPPKESDNSVFRRASNHSLNVQQDTCNMTRVFRGREGGMEMTKCEAADVKIPFPGVIEVPAEQWECGDVTEAFADQGMDVTTSHTAKVSFALSAVENQSLNFQKNFPPEESDNSVFRRASKHSLNVQQDTCNVTRVFRGQEGGMEMTKCEAAEVKIPFPGVSEVPAEQWECGDVTKAFADEGMDVTTSHTAKVSFALSAVGNQSLSFQKDFPPKESDNSVFRRASKHSLNVQQDTCNVTRVFRGQEGGMEMTKCEAADVKIPFPGVSEVPAEQWECGDVTKAFADEGMDVTTSHTAKVSFALSAVGNQSLNFQKDFPPKESDNSVFRRASNHSLNVQQDTCNVTRVFRGQEGGMEMTKCEAAGVKIPFPGVSEVPAEQWECGDVTKAFADEGMDVTTSHTAKVSFALSTVENQSLNFQKNFPPEESDNSVFRRASNHSLNVQQDPQLCADRRRAGAEGRGAPPVRRAGKQKAGALSAISVSSETIFRGDKSVVFSKCDDMEMTGNYTDIIYEASSTEQSSSCHKTCEKPVSTNPLLAGSRSLACGDIPKGLAPGGNPAAGTYKNSALELPSAPGGHMENVSQACGPAAASSGFGSHFVASGVLKSRFDPSAKPQLVFAGEKTVIFTGEDMDLAKSCVKDGGENVDHENPTALFTSATCKPHFLGNRSTPPNVTEQEEMEITRCHTVFFDGQSSGITAESKQMPCKIIPRKNQNKNVTEGDISAYSVEMDKENVEVKSIDRNIKKSQAMERNAQDLQMIMVDKKLGKTNFQASALSSCAKSMCLLQEQNRGVPESVVTNPSASLSLQSQKVVSQPLEENSPSLSGFCTNDTTGMFLGDQSMDITKAHPAAFEIAPINTEQESSNSNQNPALSKQLQNQPFPFSSRHGVEIVSQTAAMECGDLKMSTSKQIVTALAPSGSFTFSNNPAPSGMRGNEQSGTVIGRNADGQNSERQEKLQPVRAVSKEFPTQGDSDRHFSMGKTGSSREDLKTPPSARGLLQRGAEEPVWARTSEAPKESSQLSFFGEKSVVFPHGENMDTIGRCLVMVPDYSISVVLSQNKAAPGCFGQGGNETMSLEKGATTTAPAERGGQEAACGRTITFAPAEDMEITTTHTAWHRQPAPAIPADKTIVFAHDQEDMDITASHTVAVSRNVCGFEAQQVPHTNTQQPPQHTHSGLVPCRGEMDSSQNATEPEDKPSIPFSASSDSAFPSEKGATQVPSGTTPHSIYSVSLQESTVDAGAPRDHGLPTDNSEQDLTPPEKLQSKGVTSEFPSKGPVDHREESGSLGSCVAFPVQGSDPWKGHPDAPGTQRNQLVEEDSSQPGDSDLALAGANLIPAADKESKKNEELSAEGEAPPKDFQINSEQSRQPLVSDSSGDQMQTTLPPAASGIIGVCSKLMGLTRKSVSVSKTASSDQLPSSSAQPEDTLSLGKNTVSEANNSFEPKKQENTGLESGADHTGMAPKDKYPGINIPLGIFQPKLPNKRNRVSSAQDINTKSDKAEAPIPANTSETPGNKSSRQNFSPFQFIAEEFLPVCLEEMDSNESVSSELMENIWDDKNKKQMPHSEKDPFEETKTCSRKRALGQTEEDPQSPKVAKRDQHGDAGASQDLEDQAEVGEAGEPPNLSAKSPGCPQASTSSSLDSVKADIESTIQRSSQVESQLLTDSICEENLWEKFQSGAITVGEFFTLLQVHVVIQKPRHSQLPASCAVSAPPTAEDLIYSQYIHRPKLRIYEEDCQDLSRKIEELKPHVTVLDQPLVNVTRSLWEVMRTCTDEELSKFGAELNKMKSCFSKEAKILSHNEKETLYRKLLQSAEEQYRKLQSRMEKVDEWMKEVESSVAALESDSFWDEKEAGCSAGTAGGQNLQEELQRITAQEEELLRELSEMDAEDEHDLAEMEKLKITERDCLEILKKYDFTEWELMEWNDQQAVFHFLYDSVTLTVVFGPPIDDEFFAARPSRSIVSLDFESFLDEEQAPPSSCLVHKLIFQFIESRGCWQKKCPKLCYLPQALLDISLVVNRCKILGDELEFLQRWGAKFQLLETDIKDTEVKLLFSSSVAFAKFELSLALSHDYPSTVLPFRVQTHIGNIGEKEVAAVLSRVPVGHHYLQRAVSSIHQNLLQAPR